MKRSLVAVTVAIAATYVYFLIFAQYGFLKSLEIVAGPNSPWLRPVMAVMGISGITGGFVMAKNFHGRRNRGRLMAGFVVAGTAAALSWLARSPVWFLAVAGLTGVGTGMVTVGLTGMLRREIGVGRLGLCIGIGTGAAYAFCNLPPVFHGEARHQALIGILAAWTGLIAVKYFEQHAPKQHSGGPDYSPRGLALWTGIFLTLVLLDSAFFYGILHTPGPQQAIWTANPQLYRNAVMHLGAGIVTGLLMDRRLVFSMLFVGGVLLLAACSILGNGDRQTSLTVLLYTAGVSIYSTVLVFYPARGARPSQAAWVFGVAGWLGSALGISLAGSLQRTPVWLMAVCGGWLAILGILRRWHPGRAVADVQ